jgi:hypothetical protein
MDSFVAAKLSLTLAVEGHVYVPSSPAYHAVREIVSRNSFEKVDDSPWPTAKLEKANELGQAQLKPLDPETNLPLTILREGHPLDGISEHWLRFSDADADIIDMLYAIWLDQARTANDYAIVEVDQLLSMRIEAEARSRWAAKWLSARPEGSCA